MMQTAQRQIRVLGRFARQHEQMLASKRCFSSATTDTDRLPFTKFSLGLDYSYISPQLQAIRQLPEVETAWTSFPSSSTLENLNRASDVFASFSPGGAEHIAVSAMKAECQQRLAMYDASLHTLDEMSKMLETSNTSSEFAKEDMVLAKAKVHWTKGNFAEAQQLCESSINEYDDLKEGFPATNLHMASAMTGKALSQIAAMNTLDQAFSVRDYFGITCKFLERHPTATSLPSVAAGTNAGIAEVIYNNFLEETNDVSVPMDSALKTLFQALRKIPSGASESAEGGELAVIRLLETTIQSNLAWGVLNYEKDRKDRLEKASEYAKKALQALGPTGEESPEVVRRVLAIVACCYHEAGSAVTAEGLFQSAIDRKNLHNGPLPLLELREAHELYAKLCSKWEKREGDAKRLQEAADEINASLDPAWQGKSGVHGSLWFWMPADFQ